MNKLNVEIFTYKKQNRELSFYLYLERMNDIYKTRRKNVLLLREIAEAAYNHSKQNIKKYTDAMFSDYIGLSKPYFSQLKKVGSDKSMSEPTARKIEARVALPSHWLDKNHECVDYQDVYLDGVLIKKIILLYDQFLNLEGIDVSPSESTDRKKSGMIEDIILKTSKYQDISIDDLLSSFIKN